MSFDTASKVTGLGTSNTAWVCEIFALTSVRFAARLEARSELGVATEDEAMVRNKTNGVNLDRSTIGLNMHGGQRFGSLDTKHLTVGVSTASP